MKLTVDRFDFGANTTSELAVDASTYLHCVIVKRAEVHLHPHLHHHHDLFSSIFEMTTTLQVSITGRSSPEAVFYGGEVNTENNNQPKECSFKEDLNQVRGESAMREESELGPAVSHRYLVRL